MHLSPLLLAAVLVPQINAWGSVGHEVVATVAQLHLHPSVMPKLCAILHVDTPECHLAPIAAWADRVRRVPKYRWTSALHYIGAVDDYPSTTCAFPGANGWNGRTHINVLHAIRNTTSVLQDYESRLRAGIAEEPEPEPEPEPMYVQDALKFLIHFVGDMHMPLHLTARHRGGNEDKVAFDGRTTNIHTVWDSLLIAERLRTIPRNYTHPLPLPDVEALMRDTIYDPYIRRIVWEGLLGKWQDEIDTWLVCPAVSPLRRPSPTSSWQTVLAFFSGKSEEEGKDDLGVDDANLCPYAWAKPINQLNCDIVFPKELDFAPLDHGDVDEHWDEDGDGDVYDAFMARPRRPSPYLELYTPDYAGRIKEEWIIEKLLTQAGVRLAGVLNWIFAEFDEDEDARYLTL